MSTFLKTIIDSLYIQPVFWSKEDCYEQGQAAYSQAYSRTQNPYPKGTQRHEWWDSAWCDEQDELCGEP